MQQVPSDSKQAHILIVDDDEMMRMMASIALEQAGFRVSTATDGAELVPRFATLAPDLVLLDVMMPTVDGFTACTALRASPGGAHVPVLMMTGLDDIDSINRAYEAGATDFVTKPINYVLLGHRLGYILRAQATANRLRASEAKLGNAQRVARLGYWEADGDGRFEPWNEYTRAMLGYGVDAVVANFEALIARIADRDRQPVRRVVTRALAGGEGFNFECRVDAADGEVRDVRVEGVPQSRPDGARSWFASPPRRFLIWVSG